MFSLDHKVKGSAIKFKLHLIEIDDAFGFNTVFVIYEGCLQEDNQNSYTFTYKNIKDDKCFGSILSDGPGAKGMNQNEFLSGQEFFTVKELEIYTIDAPAGPHALQTRIRSLEQLPAQIGWESSAVLVKEDIKFLKWALGDGKDELRLRCLYKATVNGDTQSDFDRCCEGQANCFVLVKTRGGSRFGGFRGAAFQRGLLKRRDPRAFFFSLDHYMKGEGAKGKDHLIDGGDWLLIFDTAFGVKAEFISQDHNENWTNSFYDINVEGQYEIKIKKQVKPESHMSGRQDFWIAELEVY